MAGYWIVRASEVTDQEAQQNYGRTWAPVGERYGAKIIAGPGRVTTREGAAIARAFIVRFDSYEQAVACYEDPEYQAAAEFGRKASQRDIVILEGP
jgi:uncharacterized protein (DUF1330 family)